jgi:hypothetical protein
MSAPHATTLTGKIKNASSAPLPSEVSKPCRICPGELEATSPEKVLASKKEHGKERALHPIDFEGLGVLVRVCGASSSQKFS